MLRPTLPILAVICFACAPDNGPTKVSGPEGPNYTAHVNNPGEGGALNTDQAYAQALLTHVHVKTRECDGADGHYAESKNVFTGTSTGDPRLSGAAEFEMLYDLLNVTALHGPDIATITIRDPATGRVKAQGTASSWGGPPGDWLEGTIVGVVRDDGGGAEETTGRGQWIANFRTEFRPTGVVIDIGRVAPINQAAAGIYSGGCPGVKWTEFDFEIGGAAPQALSATATDAWRRRTGM
jgi:hypothetical protein